MFQDHSTLEVTSIIATFAAPSLFLLALWLLKRYISKVDESIQSLCSKFDGITDKVVKMQLEFSKDLSLSNDRLDQELKERAKEGRNFGSELRADVSKVSDRVIDLQHQVQNETHNIKSTVFEKLQKLETDLFKMSETASTMDKHASTIVAISRLSKRVISRIDIMQRQIDDLTKRVP